MNVELRKVLVVIVSILVGIWSCNGQSTLADRYTDEDVDPETLLESSKESITEKATQMIEELALIAEKSSKVDSEDTKFYYDNMAKVLDDIILAVKDKSHAHDFLNSKGLARVISANLGINHQEIKTKLLIILKILFDVAPVTTNALIPKGIVTRLLDIFENNPNLALKAHSLDIMHKWLPNNPDVQVRVMKLKGLEPFYNQINKLDISVIQTLLDLFNTILKEHVKARSEDAKIDHERRVIYQRIGLLERMETSNVCNGLVNIFQVVWAYNQNGELMRIVLDLIKNSKPFCGQVLKGKTKAVALLENLLKFVKNEDKKPFFQNIGLDTTEFESVLEDYVDTVKTAKDEF